MTVNYVVTPEAQEALAVALEEAALRVRQCMPTSVEFDVQDCVDQIYIGNYESIPGMRSPQLRQFRIEW